MVRASHCHQHSEENSKLHLFITSPLSTTNQICNEKYDNKTAKDTSNCYRHNVTFQGVVRISSMCTFLSCKLNLKVKKFNNFKLQNKMQPTCSLYNLSARVISYICHLISVLAAEGKGFGEGRYNVRNVQQILLHGATILVYIFQKRGSQRRRFSQPFSDIIRIKHRLLDI